MARVMSITQGRSRDLFYLAAIMLLAMASWLTATSSAKAAELTPAGSIATLSQAGDTTLPLVPTDAFQNSCTATRQSGGETAAEALNEGRGVPVPDPSPVVAWRQAFGDYSRNGPIEPRYCWFNSQSPDDFGPINR